MLRRHFLACTALTPLAACHGAITGPSITALAADVSIVAAGMTQVLKALSSLPIVSSAVAAVVASVQTYVGGLQAVAASIASVPAGTPPATVADKIKLVEGFLNSIVTALAGLAFLPPPISMYLAAAAFLLPILEAVVGLVANVIAPPPAPVAVTTPDQARTILSTPIS